MGGRTHSDTRIYKSHPTSVLTAGMTNSPPCIRPYTKTETINTVWSLLWFVCLSDGICILSFSCIRFNTDSCVGLSFTHAHLPKRWPGRKAENTYRQETTHLADPTQTPFLPGCVLSCLCMSTMMNSQTDRQTDRPILGKPNVHSNIHSSHSKKAVCTHIPFIHVSVYVPTCATNHCLSS